MSDFFSAIPFRSFIWVLKLFGTVLWSILKAQWIVITTFFSSLRIPILLLTSTPQAVFSFFIAPFHFISSIPEFIRLFFSFSFHQVIASIGSTALAAWLSISFITYRATKVGRGVEAFYNFLFWVPIYSTILVVLSNLGPLRELFSTLSEFFYSSPWSAAFVFLFIFKFLKIAVHLFSHSFLSSYKLPPLHPTVLPSDVTAIIPTVGDFGAEFIQTVETILDNNPAKIIVSTVGTGKLIQARRVVEGIMRARSLPGRTIEVVAIHQLSKRAQSVHASLNVKTDLIAYADDHVIWPPTFLQSVLAEFEDSNVGIVGTCKRVVRDRGNNWSDSIRNFIACVYIDRQNFELTATYNIDGGVSIISGRTYLVRTDIIQSLKYRQEFLSETFLGFGPIDCDDDYFVTRYMLKHGWKTVFHNRPEAMVQTTLGTSGSWPKFFQQLLCWARSVWRSLLKTVFIDGKCWKAIPWTSYAVFLSGFFNIALIYDPLLFITLFKSEFYTQNNHAGAYLLWALILSRLIKSWNYHMRNTHEIFWTVPLGFLFTYVHGCVRLIALLTCGDISWEGRDSAALAPPK